MNAAIYARYSDLKLQNERSIDDQVRMCRGVAEKKGWEVVWIKYTDDTEAVGGAAKPVRVPQYVYVERVYDTVALSTALGFGG